MVIHCGKYCLWKYSNTSTMSVTNVTGRKHTWIFVDTQISLLDHIATALIQLLPTASEGWGKYCFHRCLLSTPGGGGTPVPGSFPGPFGWGGGYPSPGQGVLQSQQGGSPVIAGRVPQIPLPLSQDRTGLSPTPRYRTAKRTLATWWAVCLLRSRRRTFLFLSNSQYESQRKSPLRLCITEYTF